MFEYTAGLEVPDVSNVPQTVRPYVKYNFISTIG